MGFFLLLNGGDDEQAFWLFVAVTRKNLTVGNDEKERQFDGIEGLYQDAFPLYHQLLYIFTILFEEMFPELKEHFENEGMGPAIWLMKWFMTLFLSSFPMGLCIRVWDNFLAEGRVFMFKFPLAIMKIFEQQMLNSSIEGLNDLINSLYLEETYPITFEQVISIAQKIKVTGERVNELKKQYENMIKVDKPKIVNMIPIIEEDVIQEQIRESKMK